MEQTILGAQADHHSVIDTKIINLKPAM